MLMGCVPAMLTSIVDLQWELGNYYQSFTSMLGSQLDSSTLSSDAAFLEPNIGLYCLTLSTKNIMRNSIGDQNAVILSRWAILMRATALNRCGLPVSLFYNSCKFILQFLCYIYSCLKQSFIRLINLLHSKMIQWHWHS